MKFILDEFHHAASTRKVKFALDEFHHVAGNQRETLKLCFK
jgi:hypothetical protein